MKTFEIHCGSKFLGRIDASSADQALLIFRAQNLNYVAASLRAELYW